MKKNVFLIVILVLLLCINTACIHTERDITIGFIPDTQNLTQTDAEGRKIKAMNQFFVDNKNNLNVVFVAALGDMAQGYPRNGDWDDIVAIPAEYDRVKAAYDIYTLAGIPYAPCMGNHDPVSSLNQWFPVSHFENTSTWGGSMNGGIENAYYLFEAESMAFILVTVEYNAPDDVLNWARKVFEEYPLRHGIFVTHQLTPIDSSRAQKQVIEQCDNVFLSVAGHNSQESYWTSTSPSGNQQHNFIVDFQNEPDGGATVRYYILRTNKNQIDVRTYNIPTKTHYTDNDSHFSFNYNMDAGKSRKSRSE
jgi:hypothetical protein